MVFQKNFTVTISEGDSPERNAVLIAGTNTPAIHWSREGAFSMGPHGEYELDKDQLLTKIFEGIQAAGGDRLVLPVETQKIRQHAEALEAQNEELLKVTAAMTQTILDLLQEIHGIDGDAAVVAVLKKLRGGTN
jgi:hypothetical protein